jgi:hypothetical protein
MNPSLVFWSCSYKNNFNSIFPSVTVPLYLLLSSLLRADTFASIHFFSLYVCYMTDRLCGLVVRVPGYTTEIYCASWEVRSEYICYVEESRPPLWSSGQSSWLQVQRSGFDSQRYQIFWELVDLERGPLSHVSIIEELLEIKCSGSGLERREYCRRDPPRWPRGTIYP